jgi:uncharacterized protein DUF2750
VSQAGSQAAAFYRDAATNGAVWTVRDEGGYPAPTTREGVRTQPFWSSRSRVERIVATVPAYAGFDVEEIPLDEFLERWLPGLEQDGLLVGVNWSGPRATGYDVEPDAVRAAIAAASQS